MPSRSTLVDLQNLGLPSQLLAGLAGGTAQQLAALNAASAEVDSYLGAHFTLPLVQYGQDIVLAEVELAAYTLLMARGFNPQSQVDMAVVERAKDRRAWLQKISTGQVVPAVVDSSVGGRIGGVFVSTSDPRGWNGESAGNYSIETAFWDPGLW